MNKRRNCLGICAVCLAISLLLWAISLPLAAVTYPTPQKMTSVLLYNVENAVTLLEVDGGVSVNATESTRLMTALTAYTALHDRMGENVTLTDEMVGTAGGYELAAGDRISVADLFTLMLLRGADDATQSLAVLAGGSERSFTAQMNQKAQALGMTDTVYTGAFPRQRDESVTTARDTAILASTFYTISFLTDITAQGTATVTVNGEVLTVHSRCALDYRNGYYTFFRNDIQGLIVSDTADTVVAQLKVDDLTYIGIVFGAPAITWDTMTSGYNVPEHCSYETVINLLDFARTGFESRLLFHSYDLVGELPVKLSRQSDSVGIVPSTDVRCFLPVDTPLSSLSISATYDVSALEAPVKLSQKVGTLRISLDNTVLTEVDLVTNHTVSKSLLSELAASARYVLFHPAVILLGILLIALLIFRLIRSARLVTAARLSEQGSTIQTPSSSDGGNTPPDVPGDPKK